MAAWSQAESLIGLYVLAAVLPAAAARQSLDLIVAGILGLFDCALSFFVTFESFVGRPTFCETRE